MPKVRVLEKRVGNCISLYVEFDYGWRGAVTFPLGTKAEEIKRQLLSLYEQMKPRPEAAEELGKVPDEIG